MARWPATLLAVLTLFFYLNPAEAQDKKKTSLDVDAVFKKLDTNHDDKLTKAEFLRLADRFKDRAKAREKLTASYQAIDPRNVGLSKDQFRKYLDSVKKKDETPH